MAKTTKLDFKDWMYTVKVPSREKEFLDKHPVSTKEDRNGNKDDVFKASNVKFSQDGTDKHGYKNGEDAKVYEEVEQIDEAMVKKKKYSWGKLITIRDGSHQSFPLHPEHQEKISRLKHGETAHLKLETGDHVSATRDNDDVHLKYHNENRITKVGIHHFNESTEINEISKKTLGSYIKKANSNLSTHDKEWNKLAGKTSFTPEEEKKFDHHDKQAEKRYYGLQKASQKMYGGAKIKASNESAESLTEGKKEAKSLDALHKQMKDIRDSHQKQFTKDVHSILADKGYKKLHDGKFRTTYQKIDSDDTIHHMHVSKDYPEVRYCNTNTGRNSYHNHDISHDKSDLSDGIDKMIHGGQYY